MAPFRPDGSGDAPTHFWSVVSAPAGAKPAFSDAGWSNTSVSNLTVAGTYIFRLAALDRTKMTTRDVTMSIPLNPGQQIARYLFQDLNRPQLKGSMVLRAQGGGTFAAVALVQNQQLLTVALLTPAKAPNIPN